MHISVRIDKDSLDKLKDIGVGPTEVFNKGLSFYLGEYIRSRQSVYTKEEEKSTPVYTDIKDVLRAKVEAVINKPTTVTVLERPVKKYSCGCEVEKGMDFCYEHGNN